MALQYLRFVKTELVNHLQNTITEIDKTLWVHSLQLQKLTNVNPTCLLLFLFLISLSESHFLNLVTTLCPSDCATDFFPITWNMEFRKNKFQTPTHFSSSFLPNLSYGVCAVFGTFPSPETPGSVLHTESLMLAIGPTTYFLQEHYLNASNNYVTPY